MRSPTNSRVQDARATALLVATAMIAATACTRGPEPERFPPTPRRTGERLERPDRTALVGLLGASVTAGFSCPWTDPGGEPNRTVPLSTALRALWPEPRVRLRSAAHQAAFTDPETQAPLVSGLNQQQPDLVLAVDFMFWFGYGAVGVIGKNEIEARLRIQRQGLALLDGLDAIVLVGDYPDVRGADARMIAPAQIPSPEALRALNDELGRWAAARPRTYVFPLADTFERMLGSGLEARIGDERVRVSSDALMQSDRLHPRRLGVAILAQRIAEHLRRLDLGVDQLDEPTADGEALVRRCRAELDLADALDDGRAKRLPPEPGRRTLRRLEALRGPEL